MKVRWGYCAAERKNGRDVPVEWDSRTIVNGHALIVGGSGMGKTYTLRRMISEMLETAQPGKAPRIHVFDVHGDIEIEGASTVQFSEQTTYGMNPLRINPDPHYGGVRKRIQGFVATINKVMQKLGTKQEAVLRNILLDVYTRHGFRHDDPDTWHINDDMARLVSDGSDNRLYLDVPMAEKDTLKELGVGARWDNELRCWWIPPEAYTGAVTRWSPKTLDRTHPSISDALRYARNRLQMSFLGTGVEAITNLEIANKAAAAYQRKVLDALRRGDATYKDEAMQADIEKAKAKAVETFTDYVRSISSGNELNDLMKYDSTEVLKSVVERLENLNAIGIFKPMPAPFDPRNPVWRYHIKALSKEERKLFVLFRLEELFAQAVQRGEQEDITEVIILDEAHIYADDDDQNIINTISKEARKFGVALIAGSQSPTHFPEDFIASVATKVILGIDEMYWRGCVNKLRVTEQALDFVKSKRTILVQMKASGQQRNAWRWVHLK